MTAPSPYAPTPLVQRRPIRPNDLGVPLRGLLRRSGTGRVVAIHETKALPVPLGPLEVVDEGPVEVALDRDAGVHRALELEQVATREVDAERVLNAAVHADTVRAGDAVLGDDDRLLVTVVAKARGEVHGLGDDGPVERRARVTGREGDLLEA